MKALNRLPVPPPYISYLIAIREAKRVPSQHQGTVNDHKGILEASHQAIADRYAAFDQAIDDRNLHTLSSSQQMRSITSSLRSCYNNDTKILRDLKSAITAVQGLRALKYCPMCGITTIATHDHYIPATWFPEF